MDYHANTVYRTLYPLVGKKVRVQLQPFGGNFSASRPRHIFDVLITQVPAMNAAYGQLSTFQTLWPVTGDIDVVPRPYFEGEMTVGGGRLGQGVPVGRKRLTPSPTAGSPATTSPTRLPLRSLSPWSLGTPARRPTSTFAG